MLPGVERYPPASPLTLKPGLSSQAPTSSAFYPAEPLEGLHPSPSPFRNDPILLQGPHPRRMRPEGLGGCAWGYGKSSFPSSLFIACLFFLQKMEQVFPHCYYSTFFLEDTIKKQGKLNRGRCDGLLRLRHELLKEV